MKKLLVVIALIAIFAVAFASLNRDTKKQNQAKKPAKSEKKCSYVYCMSAI